MPLGGETSGVCRHGSVLGKLRSQLVVARVDASVAGMGFHGSGAGFKAGVPLNEDRPLLPLAGQGGRAGGPDEVLVVRLVGMVVTVDSLKVVRLAADVRKPTAGPVIPIVLDVNAFEAVMFAVVIVDRLRHGNTLSKAADTSVWPSRPPRRPCPHRPTVRTTHTTVRRCTDYVL